MYIVNNRVQRASPTLTIPERQWSNRIPAATSEKKIRCYTRTHVQTPRVFTAEEQSAHATRDTAAKSAPSLRGCTRVIAERMSEQGVVTPVVKLSSTRPRVCSGFERFAASSRLFHRLEKTGDAARRSGNLQSNFNNLNCSFFFSFLNKFLFLRKVSLYHWWSRNCLFMHLI